MKRPFVYITVTTLESILAVKGQGREKGGVRHG